MGFPTANIVINLDIPYGVYAGSIIMNQKEYLAAINYGQALTFNDNREQAEIYILDFSGDLYDQELTVKLTKKIRDTKKFNTSEELTKQIQEDINIIRKCSLE